MNIEELGLSFRVLSRLKLRNIQTVYDLTRYSKEELSRFDGFGQICLNEVILKLSEYNLNLKASPLDKYNFSVRTRGVLKRAGIYHLEKLAELTEEAILSYRNAGVHVLEEIKQKMKESGLKLKDSLPRPKEEQYNLTNEVILVGEVSNVHVVKKSDTLLIKLTIDSNEGKKQTFQCIYFGRDVQEKQNWLVKRQTIRVRARVYKGQYQNMSFRIQEFLEHDPCFQDHFQITFSGFIRNPYQTKTGVRFELHKNEREFLICHMKVTEGIDKVKTTIRNYLDLDTPIVVKGKSGILKSNSFILYTEEQIEQVEKTKEEALA